MRLVSRKAKEALRYFCTDSNTERRCLQVKVKKGPYCLLAPCPSRALLPARSLQGLCQAQGRH